MAHRPPRQAARQTLGALVLALGAAACGSDPTSGAADLPSRDGSADVDTVVVVSAVDPGASPRNRTLDVRILGSDFSEDATAEFLMGGAPDEQIVVNRVTYVSPTELSVNITVTPSAVPATRDVAVRLPGGKKGIGTELFVVVQGDITFEELGRAQPWAVNRSGAAVGEYRIYPGAGNQWAFVWTMRDGVQALPAPAGYLGGMSARRINESGLIAGVAVTGGGIGRGQVVLWHPVSPWRWIVEALPSPPTAPYLMGVRGLTNDGIVLADWMDTTTSAVSPWTWSPSDAWRPLARPAGSDRCWSEALNDARAVVGRCEGTSPGAYCWAPSSALPVALPSPPGGYTLSATAITSSGMAAGGWRLGTQTRVVRWTPGVAGWIAEDLGALGQLEGLNDDGEMILLGEGTAGGAFFRYSDGSVSSLEAPSLPTGAPFATLSNRAENGYTWVVGWGPTSTGGGIRASWWKR